MPRIKVGYGAFTVLAIVLFSGGNWPVLLGTLAALGIHEFAHLITSKLLGYRIFELKITPWGGRMELETGFGMEPGSEAWIAAAGPAINLLMVGGVSYLNLLGFATPLLLSWGHLNLFIGGINLIPAFPLDGGRILHAFLTAHFGLPRAERYCRVLNWIIAGLILTLGIMQITRDPGGIILLLVGSLVLSLSFGNSMPEVLVTRQLLERKKKRLANQGFLKVKPVLVSPHTPVRIPLEHCRSSNYLLFMAVDPHGKLTFIPEEAAWERLLSQGFDARFGQPSNGSAPDKVSKILHQSPTV